MSNDHKKGAKKKESGGQPTHMDFCRVTISGILRTGSFEVHSKMKGGGLSQ